MELAEVFRGVTTRLRQLVDVSAHEWGLSSRWARWHFWFPLALSVVTLVSRLYRPVYHFIVREDGIVEWATFLCAALAAWGAAFVAHRRWSAGRQGQMILFALVAMTMALIAGEEISWGQRILGIETPEALRNVNRKSEINLHNIGDFLSWTRIATLLAGFYATFAWPVNRSLRIERRILDADVLFVPPFFLSSSFLVVFLFSLSQLTLLPLIDSTSTRFAEISELCLAYGCCIYLWMMPSKLRVATSESARDRRQVYAVDDRRPVPCDAGQLPPN